MPDDQLISPTEVEEITKPTKPQRRWRWRHRYLAYLFLGYLVWCFIDVPARPDDDLMPSPRIVPPTGVANPIEVWHLVSNGLSPTFDQAAQDLLSGKVPPIKQIKIDMDKIPGALEWAQPIPIEAWSFPERGPLGPIPLILRLNDCWKKRIKEVDEMIASGKTKEAAFATEGLLNASLGFGNNSSTLVTYLIELAILRMTVDECPRWKEPLAEHPEIAQRVMKRLESLPRALETSGKDAFRSEYQNFKWVIQEKRSLLTKGQPWKERLRVIGMRALMKPNMTKNQFQEGHTRPMLKALSLYCPSTPIPKAYAMTARPKEIAWQFAKGNLGGAIILEIAMPALGNLAKTSREVATKAEKFRCQLAMKLHEKKYGIKPVTIKEMVPEFLDSVPLNPADGSEVFIDAATGEVGCDP